MAAALGHAPTQKDKARVFQALRIAVNRELERLGLDPIEPACEPGAPCLIT